MNEGTIGIVGLGVMGGPIAANLARQGYDLIVHDVDRARAATQVARGARWADSPREVAARCLVVLLSLPTPSIVEAVCLSGGGLLDGHLDGAVCIDLSTNSPSTVRRIHAAYAQRGRFFLDAPVSGGPEGAASGRLALWASGDQTAFDSIRHVLDAVGDQVRYIGDSGAGTIAKLVHNCAAAAVQCAISEAFSLGIKAGVDPLTLFVAIEQGATGRRPTFECLVNQVLPNRYDPPPPVFSLRLFRKDVSLALALAEELGVPMRMAQLTFAEMTEAMNRGWGDRAAQISMRVQQERVGNVFEIPSATLAEARAAPRRLRPA